MNLKSVSMRFLTSLNSKILHWREKSMDARVVYFAVNVKGLDISYLLTHVVSSNSY